MDDYLDSRNTLEVALKRSKDLVEMRAKGGFKLTTFASNFPAFTAELNASELHLVAQTFWALPPTCLG